ncbi:MAG: hypothetical protein OXF61_14710 [Acidimicrobiaceae bacterium]|nr:hypothetical protein [Acidimicrobiaceae bacterium]
MWVGDGDNPVDVNGDGKINEDDEAELEAVPASLCWVPRHPPCPANVLLVDAQGLPGQDPESLPDKPMEYIPESGWCEAETDDPAVVAECLRRDDQGEVLREPDSPPGIKGYVNESPVYGGEQWCKIVYPARCPPGLFRISDDACRGYQRRAWECIGEGYQGYRPGNQYLTCHADPATVSDPASGGPACAAGAPLSGSACEQYVGSDFAVKPTHRVYKCKRYTEHFVEVADITPPEAVPEKVFTTSRPNTHWCSYRTARLADCAADDTSGICNPASMAQCLKRDNKATALGLHTGGCAAVATTMGCVKLRAEHRQVQAGENTDARRAQLRDLMNKHGCSLSVCLPFAGQDAGEDCEEPKSGRSARQFNLVEYIISTNTDGSGPYQRLAILARALVALNWEEQHGEAFNPGRDARAAFESAKLMYDDGSVDQDKPFQNLPPIGFADFARIVKMQADGKWPFDNPATQYLVFNGPAQTAVFARFRQEPTLGTRINDRQTTYEVCKPWRLTLLDEMEEGRRTPSADARPPNICDSPSWLKCRPPTIGRMESESEHVSGRAIANHQVALRLSGLPTERAEFRYIKAEQGAGRTVTFSQQHVDLVGYDSGRVLRFQTPTAEDGSRRAYSDRTQIRGDADCSISEAPRYSATIEELWPDEDRALIERLFGAEALAWWDNPRTDKGAASRSRGFQWLQEPGLTDAEKQAERSRRRSRHTREILCREAEEAEAGGRICSWVPARSGYFAIRGIGEWQVTATRVTDEAKNTGAKAIEPMPRLIDPSGGFDTDDLWKPVLDAVLSNATRGGCAPDTVERIKSGQASNLQDNVACLEMAASWAAGFDDPESTEAQNELVNSLARAGLRQDGRGNIQLLDVPDDKNDYPPWYEVCARPVYQDGVTPESRDLRYTCIGNGTTVTVLSSTPTIGIVVYEVQTQRR